MVVPNMWQEASINGTIQKLASIMNVQPMGLDKIVIEQITFTNLVKLD